MGIPRGQPHKWNVMSSYNHSARVLKCYMEDHQYTHDITDSVCCIQSRRQGISESLPPQCSRPTEGTGPATQLFVCRQRRCQQLKPDLTAGSPLRWRHNDRDGVSNHQPYDCLLNHLFRRRSKKTSKLPVTGLCAGNLPVTGEFPAQRASNAENVSIWWRHNDCD